MSDKLKKYLPKRSTNAKLKERRQRSWTQNKNAKAKRIDEQKKREEYNASIGCTGKMRATNKNHSDFCSEVGHVEK